MKELTYEDWQENPIPRMMWVWDEYEMLKVKRKVVYILRENYVLNRVITIDNDDSDYELYKHCAEIEKQRRMTNKELARWLREKPTRELRETGDSDSYVYSSHIYEENCGDEEVCKGINIREDDGEWREPLVEVEE